MADIKINKDKCAKCGSCIKDCITYSLERDSEGFAQTKENYKSLCISCKHCLAVCPTGAIDIDGVEAQSVDPSKFGDAEEILNTIKSRRSIRQYKEEDITSEDFKKIKDMLPYIPTGCNANTLHFSFIEKRSAMEVIKEYTRTKILKLISNCFTRKYAGKFAAFKNAFENGEDVIYRDAPAMVVVSSSIHAPCANTDPIIALSYIELYAQSLGIGTCWCGFAQACFKLLPKLSQMVGVPDGYKPVYVMLLGYPDVKYYRTTTPNGFPITEIQALEPIEMSLTERLHRLLLNFIR